MAFHSQYLTDLKNIYGIPIMEALGYGVDKKDNTVTEGVDYVTIQPAKDDIPAFTQPIEWNPGIMNPDIIQDPVVPTGTVYHGAPPDDGGIWGPGGMTYPGQSPTGTVYPGETRPKTDAEMAEIYRQQRELAQVNTLGVTAADYNSGERGYDSAGNLKEGWALGIDGVPYNTALFALNDAAIAAAGGGGGSGGGYGGGGGGSSASVLNTRMPLNRTPSGSVYAPDLSAYNDSSLFNYTGPGGASEYTYGQGLPYQGAGYNLWGSPTDVANPYFWGQFANAAATGAATGPADAAINMPSVEMPAGVPSTNATTTPSGTFDPYKGEAVLNQNVTKTTFPSPPGANLSLADRQRAQMGDAAYQSIIDRTNAMDRQLIEGQLSNVPESNYGMEWQSGAGYDGLLDNRILRNKEGGFNINQLDLGEERYNYLFNDDLDLGRPGDPSYEEFVADPSLFTTANAGRGNIVEGVGDRAASYANAGRGNIVEPLGERAAYGANAGRGNIVEGVGDRAASYANAGRGSVVEQPGERARSYITDRTPELLAAQELERQESAREMLRQSVLNPDNTEYNTVFGGIDGTPVSLPPERSIWKADEMDIQTPNEPLYQIPERTYGNVNADTTVSDYSDFEGTRNRPSVYDLPENSYAREVYLGEIPAESTSSLTATELSDSIEAIDAKYKGSTTDASSEAELGEIINTITSSYDKEKSIMDAGGLSPALSNYLMQDAQSIASRNPNFPEEHFPLDDGSRMTVEESDIPAYLSGGDSELSTRDLIEPSLIYLEDRAGRHSASSDLFAQNERQQRGRGTGLGQALQNQAIANSIFSKPDIPVIRSGPSLFEPTQIRPSVAQTQNNMTVPTTRDAALTARYGQPYRRYGL